MNIESATRDNTLWRNVLHTSDSLQVVAMSVPPGQALGKEVHSNNDQFFRVEQGNGVIVVTADKKDITTPISDGVAAIVPAGMPHNVINTSDVPLKLYTIYGPPHHPAGTKDATHADEITRTDNK